MLTLYFIFLGILVIYVDIREMRIPNILSLGYLLGLIIYLISKQPPLTDVGGGIFIGMSLLLLCYWLTKGGIGEGDIKICFPLCGLLGIGGTLYFLLLASISSLPIGIYYLLHKKGRAHAFPFGPFLIISFLIIWFIKKGAGHLLI